MLQLHIRPRGEAALPAWEGLYRKEVENGEQETAFNIIALSLYSIFKYNLISCVYCVYLYRDLIRYARRNGMNWKYEAIEKLKEYSAKKQSLKSIPEEMARLESAMQSIRSATADGTPVSGGGSGREDMMLSNIVHREELARSLEQARKWVSLVDSGLESLSVDEKKILSRFYISPARGNVDALCEELGVEKAQVYRRRDSALRHFTLCLYGQTES